MWFVRIGDYYNAPGYDLLLYRGFLFYHKYYTVMMHQSSYSTDMDPCDFFLSPKIRRTLNDRRFTSIDAIKNASLRELTAIPKMESQKCYGFEKKKSWNI